MKWIIHRYILKSLLIPFGLALFTFTFTFFIYRVFQLTEMVVNRGMFLSDVVKVFVYASPYFFMFTIPMAVLFSVILTFLKLSSDNEITALKAAGLSLYKILPPVYYLVGLGFAMTLITATVLVPRGNTAMADLIFEMTSSRADVAIRERLFIDNFEGLAMYVEKVDPKTRELRKVFVYDDRDPDVDAAIMAERGAMLRDPVKREVVLRLYDGAIDRLARNWTSTQTIKFSTYDLKLNIRELAAARKTANRHRSEYKMGELSDRMKAATEAKKPRDYRQYATIYHERLAIPFGCLVLGLIGVPLALQSNATGRAKSKGVFLGVAAFLVYYLLYSAFRGFGDQGLMPPAVSLWIPNLIFVLLVVTFIRRSARELPLVSWERVPLAERAYRLGARLQGKRSA